MRKMANRAASKAYTEERKQDETTSANGVASPKDANGVQVA